MALIEKYDRLVYELQERKARIAHVGHGDYPLHQRLIDQAGVKVIAIEVEHGIDEARRLIEHERFVRPQLAQFTEMAEKYSQPVDWTAEYIAPEDLEERIAVRAQILSEAKKSVSTLKKMADDCGARRKKLSKEALEIASRPDVLNAYERDVFTQMFTNTRAERASKATLQEILKPLEPSPV